jgi:hypothetical protein
MTIELTLENILKGIAKLNIFIIIVLYADYFIPLGNTVKTNVKSTELDIVSVAVSDGRTNTTKGDRRYFLYLQNSDILKFNIEPEFYYNIKDGEQVIINYTFLLHKIKSFEFPESNIKENTSFIVKRTNFLLMMGVLLASILNLVWSKFPAQLCGIGLIIIVYVLAAYLLFA